MEKCSCYREYIEYDFNGDKKVSRCYGTKEIDICKCGGDISKCDFSPQKTEKTEDILAFPETPITKLTLNFKAKIDERVDDIIMNTISDVVNNEIDSTLIINKNMIKEAISKHVAKKVVTKQTDYDGHPFIFTLCPSCEKSLFTQENYCRDCGQHLDWSLEEDKDDA